MCGAGKYWAFSRTVPMGSNRHSWKRRKGRQNPHMARSKHPADDTLSTFQIENAMRRCKITAPLFVGVFSLDHLPKGCVTTRPGLIVCNTAYSGSGGEHWVGFFLTHNSLQFFDAFGLPPRGEHMTGFIAANDSTHTFTYNTTPLQGINASTCGKYVATYLYFCALGCSMRQYLSLLYPNPDANVRKLYRNIFGGGVKSCNWRSSQKCYKYNRNAWTRHISK